jgi:hypothetical protein
MIPFQAPNLMKWHGVFHFCGNFFKEESAAKNIKSINFINSARNLLNHSSR